MTTARAAHTATALPDGRVLVVGGFTADEGRPAGAEIYDHARGAWRELTGGTRRQSHSATRLSGGRVLLAGGYGDGGATLDSCEIYDPHAGAFTAAVPLGTPRAGHEAVALGNGRVLIVGGVGRGWTFLASAEVIDPASGAVTPTGSMTVARESHAALRLTSGRVLVMAGHHGRGDAVTILASTEIYDPRAGRFMPGPPLGTPRHKHDATLLDDGRVLITGGADHRDDRGVYATTELVDAAATRVTTGPGLQRGRYKHRGTSVVLAPGRVLLAGGGDAPEVLDLVTGTSRAVAMGERMAGQFTAAARLGGAVLVTGGYGDGRRPRADTWLLEG